VEVAEFAGAGQRVALIMILASFEVWRISEE
jgi:hypothetical protein